MTSDDKSIFRIIGIVCFAGTGMIAGIACYWHRDCWRNMLLAAPHVIAGIALLLAPCVLLATCVLLTPRVIGFKCCCWHCDCWHRV